MGLDGIDLIFKLATLDEFDNVIISIKPFGFD